MTVLPSARYWRVNSNPNPRLAPVISTAGMAYPRRRDHFRVALLCRVGAADRKALPREVEGALARKEYDDVGDLFRRAGASLMRALIVDRRAVGGVLRQRVCQ